MWRGECRGIEERWVRGEGEDRDDLISTTILLPL